MAQRREITLDIDEDDIQLLNKLFEAEIKKSKTIIDKTRKFPSYTYSSSETRKKYDQLIVDIEDLQNRINTAALN